MNVSVVFGFLLAVFLAFASALPAVEEFSQKEPIPKDEKQFEPISIGDDEPAEMGTRFRRVTCDLLSVDLPFGSVNHAACAAHCLAMGRGFRGGRCMDGVCHCRR